MDNVAIREFYDTFYSNDYLAKYRKEPEIIRLCMYTQFICSVLTKHYNNKLPINNELREKVRILNDKWIDVNKA